MRAAERPGTRRWLLLPAAILVLSGLAAGCSSSGSSSGKPAYCTAAGQLKTSVHNPAMSTSPKTASARCRPR